MFDWVLNTSLRIVEIFFIIAALENYVKKQYGHKKKKIFFPLCEKLWVKVKLLR